MLKVENIPKELRDRPQWVLWRWEERDGRPTKPLYQTNGKYAKTDNPKTWVTFEKAFSCFSSNGNQYAGIGYVFSEKDPYVGIDWDDSRDPKTGAPRDWARKYLKEFDSYTEVSPSEKGFKTIIKGELPAGGHHSKHIGVFKKGRYFCTTGDVLSGISPDIRERQDVLNDLITQHWPGDLERAATLPKKEEQPSLNLDEHKIIDLVLTAANRSKTTPLWNGDIVAYPSHSEADQALCNIIAFYTQDPDQVDRIFRQSKLYRKKWERDDYRARTIQNAIANLTETYSPPRSAGQKLDGDKADKAGKVTHQEHDPESVLTALGSNEDGDAWLFSRAFAGKLCFDHSANQWFRWEEHYWIPDKVKHARSEIRTVIRIYASEAERQFRKEMIALQKSDKDTVDLCKDIRKAIRKRIKDLQGIQRKNHILELSADGSRALGISGDEWDQHPMWLACKNGIVDLTKGSLFEGEPHHHIKTFATAEFKGLDTPAPRWEQFLEEIFSQDNDLISYVQRLIGYGITGKTTEHIYPIAWGDGRNGKGTLFEILNYVLGEFAGPIEPEMILEQRYGRKSGSPSSDVLFLRGKRLVWASELSEGRRLDAGKLKWLTGGDTLTGRMPYGRHQVTFEPTHKLFLLTNHKPHAPAGDFALWQRIHLIPFTQAFVTEPKAENEHLADLDLLVKLKAEAPGILVWCVRGCMEWQKQGLSPPDVIKAATDRYRRDEDLMEHFLIDRCVISNDEEIEAQDLYDEYKKWCADMGHKAMSGTRFGKEIKKRFDFYKSHGRIKYLGIGLIGGE